MLRRPPRISRVYFVLQLQLLADSVQRSEPTDVGDPDTYARMLKRFEVAVTLALSGKFCHSGTFRLPDCRAINRPRSPRRRSQQRSAACRPTTA